MFNRNSQAKIEKMQEKIDAGLVSEHFPEVANIVIRMAYTQKGVKPLLRTVSFLPGSYAYFKISCLSGSCVEGGFDLTRLIAEMISKRDRSAKGELVCPGTDPRSGHSAIDYEIAIEYV